MAFQNTRICTLTEQTTTLPCMCTHTRTYTLHSRPCFGTHQSGSLPLLPRLLLLVMLLPNCCSAQMSWVRRDSEQDGQGTPFPAFLPCQEEGDGTGEGGQRRLGGSSKGRERNQKTQECLHNQQEPPPLSPPPLSLLPISPLAPTRQGPSLASSALIWKPAWRSPLVLKACHVCV